MFYAMAIIDLKNLNLNKMKRKKVINKDERYVIFTDMENQSRLLATTHDHAGEVIENQKKYRDREESIPDSLKIKAHELTKVSEDTMFDNFDLVEMKTFDFPVNRVHWEFYALTN